MTLVVREYATLSCEGNDAGMDAGVVSPATFDWLLSLQQGWKGRAELLRVEGKKKLRLCNHVGYLQSPGGETIEVLPKTEQEPPAEPDRLRRLLQRMLRSALVVKHREAGNAELLRSRTPLHEWIVGQFLYEVAELMRRGLRFDYHNVEEQCRFVRGRLDMNKQLRQTPDKATQFHVRHTEFSPERIENRLIKTALELAFKLTRHSDNWRLANSLRHQLHNIAALHQPMQYFNRWDHGKMMKGYEAVKPWCRLMLEQLNPDFQKGEHRGIALLFPMEQLFECYLASCLRRQLQPGGQLTTQASREHLLKHAPHPAHEPQGWFMLKPDFLVEHNRTPYVLDAKWKLINQHQATTEHKYGIRQADLYQMFAYGHTYLSGEGHLMLIYPKHRDFNQPLPVFCFDERLSLWCVPLDLENGELVTGEWQNAFGCFSQPITTSP